MEGEVSMKLYEAYIPFNWGREEWVREFVEERVQEYNQKTDEVWEKYQAGEDVTDELKELEEMRQDLKGSGVKFEETFWDGDKNDLDPDSYDTYCILSGYEY